LSAIICITGASSSQPPTKRNDPIQYTSPNLINTFSVSKQRSDCKVRRSPALWWINVTDGKQWFIDTLDFINISKW